MTDRSAPTATRPFAGFEWMIAGRYLRARRKEGFVSVIAGFSFLGILLGVATLIIVMAVMNGFRIELVNKILGVNGHMTVQTYGAPLHDFDLVAKTARTVPEVARATPTVEGQVMATVDQRNSGVLVRGLTPEDMRATPLVSERIVEGSLNRFEGGEVIAIGARLAAKLGLAIGDSVSLLSPRGANTPFGVAPRIKAYRVVAIFRLGMSEYDATFVYLPFEEAQLYFNLEGAASYVELTLEDPDAIEVARAALFQALGPSYRLTDWKSQNSTFLSALEVERAVMFLILSLIILVAALNIISGLIMLVKDKGRDIAILRTMGASRGSVMRVFFIAGSSIGVVGTIGGVALGLLFCRYIEEIRQFLQNTLNVRLFDPLVYFLERMPAKVIPSDVMWVTAMALGLSFLATLYPSWRAARLDPVEALRYE